MQEAKASSPVRKPLHSPTQQVGNDENAEPLATPEQRCQGGEDEEVFSTPGMTEVKGGQVLELQQRLTGATQPVLTDQHTLQGYLRELDTLEERALVQQLTAEQAKITKACCQLLCGSEHTLCFCYESSPSLLLSCNTLELEERRARDAEEAAQLQGALEKQTAQLHQVRFHVPCCVT